MKSYLVVIELSSGHRLHLLTTAPTPDDAKAGLFCALSESGIIIEDFEEQSATATLVTRMELGRGKTP